jgi:hypothetical protein
MPAGNVTVPRGTSLTSTCKMSWERLKIGRGVPKGLGFELLAAGTIFFGSLAWQQPESLPQTILDFFAPSRR